MPTTKEDFAGGGYRYKDLLEDRIVSSRGDLHDKQKNLGFPLPVKTGPRQAWFPKVEVHRWLAERAKFRKPKAAWPRAACEAGCREERKVPGKALQQYIRNADPRKSPPLQQRRRG